MNKSITQATQNDKQISNSIKKFFTRFRVFSALKASNAYKKKGVPVMEIFQYLFLLFFSNRSMYMNLITGRNTPAFTKDMVYRFMKIIQITRIRFTTILSAQIIKDAIIPWIQKTVPTFLSLMIPCLNATVPKSWNSLQESMITQSMHIVLGFGCLLLDGQMEVHLCR